MAAAMAAIYARRGGEHHGALVPVALVAGIACASLAHFLSPWTTPVVLALLLAAQHGEYRAVSRARAAIETREGADQGRD